MRKIYLTKAIEALKFYKEKVKNEEGVRLTWLNINTADPNFISEAQIIDETIEYLEAMRTQ